MSNIPEDNPAFPKDEFDGRIDKARKALVSRGLDVGLFFGSENIYYLSGYPFPHHGRFQMLAVPVDQPPFLVIRQHMEKGTRATTWIDSFATYPDTEDPVQVARRALADRKLGSARIGLEEASLLLTVQAARALKDGLSAAHFGDCSGIAEAQRLVKSPREIEYMRRAAAISDIGMDTARHMITAGVSERDIAIEVERQMAKAGSEPPVMPMQIGIEERTQLGMPLMSDRTLASGELMIIEVFGRVRRYTAGLKASFGAKPASKDADRRFEIAQRAFQRAVEAIAPGRPASVVPEAVQGTFREAGYPESPHHQSGYSTGIAFAPVPIEATMLSLRRGNTMPLQEGMTIFPIANLYGPGCTVSVSGMVVVTKTGGEILTKFRAAPSDLSR